MLDVVLLHPKQLQLVEVLQTVDNVLLQNPVVVSCAIPQLPHSGDALEEGHAVLPS